MRKPNTLASLYAQEHDDTPSSEHINRWALDEINRLRAIVGRTSQASSAEEKLTRAGVFKGAEGLRGLVEDQDFWDQQPYGTRLPLTTGGYLHRDILNSAIRILDAPEPELKIKERDLIDIEASAIERAMETCDKHFLEVGDGTTETVVMVEDVRNLTLEMRERAKSLGE